MGKHGGSHGHGPTGGHGFGGGSGGSGMGGGFGGGGFGGRGFGGGFGGGGFNHGVGGFSHHSFGHSGMHHGMSHHGSHHNHSMFNHRSSRRTGGGGIGSGGGGGGSFGGWNLESGLDAIASSMFPAKLINGIYQFAGSQMSFRTRSEAPAVTPLLVNPLMQLPIQQNMVQMAVMDQMSKSGLAQENSIQPIPFQQETPNNYAFQQNGANNLNVPAQTPPAIQQANITIVGSKTKPGNPFCIISTICLGACCCFPLCFMCCMWWKKMVNPLYELTAEAYREVGDFVRRNPTLNNLNLAVADNTFNAEKAGILYEIINRGQITGFTFVNIAPGCNGHFKEYDDFKVNVAPIKALPIGASLTWGDTVA